MCCFIRSTAGELDGRVLHLTLGLTLTIILPHAYMGHLDVVIPVWCCSRPRECWIEYAFHRVCRGPKPICMPRRISVFDCGGGNHGDQLVPIATLGAMNFAHPGYLLFVCQRVLALAFPVYTAHSRAAVRRQYYCCR